MAKYKYEVDYSDGRYACLMCSIDRDECFKTTRDKPLCEELCDPDNRLTSFIRITEVQND